MTTRTEYTDLEWELLIDVPHLRPGASARCSQPRRTVNHHPASGRASGSGASACSSPPARSWRNRGAVPSGCQGLRASSATLRPAVTPTTPVRFSSGSSVELPWVIVEPGPAAGTRPVPLVKAPLRASLRCGLAPFTSDSIPSCTRTQAAAFTTSMMDRAASKGGGAP